MARMDPHLLARTPHEKTDSVTEDGNAEYYDTSDESVEEREDSTYSEEEDENATEHFAHDAHDGDQYYHEEPDIDSEDGRTETASESDVVTAEKSHEDETTATWEQDELLNEGKEAARDHITEESAATRSETDVAGVAKYHDVNTTTASEQEDSSNDERETVSKDSEDKTIETVSESDVVTVEKSHDGDTTLTWEQDDSATDEEAGSEDSGDKTIEAVSESDAFVPEKSHDVDTTAAWDQHDSLREKEEAARDRITDETTETLSETSAVTIEKAHDVDTTTTWKQDGPTTDEEAASDRTTDDDDENRREYYDEYAEPVGDYAQLDADLSDPELPSDTDDETTGATKLDGGVYKTHSPYISDTEPGDAPSFLSCVTPHLDYQVALVQSGHDASATKLSQLLFREARQHGIVSGKWLVFAPPGVAASLWADVRYACQSGALLAHCELRTRAHTKSDWLVVAYVNDWRDATACNAVRDALQVVCDRHSVRIATFKPELLSVAGVYRHGGTYPLLALGMPVLPSPLFALRGNGARRRRKRGGKRGGEAGNRGAANVHYHGKRSNPSLPNGTWDAYETAQGWVYHHSRPAHVRGRGGTKRADALENALRARLDGYRKRIKSGEHPSSRERRAFTASLWALADKHNAVVGKWKLFAPARVADGCWRALCDANDAGQLGGCIKLAPYNSRSGAFLVCVYCNDFRDIRDCARVLFEAAHCVAPFGARFVANFKPDFMSSVGVYRASVRGYPAPYALAELGLLGEWMDSRLRAVLAKHRREARGW